MKLTGRITAAPTLVLQEEVLHPQFDYELSRLLPWYLAIEKVLLLEYQRMGLVDTAGARAVAARLSTVSAGDLAADPDRNFSDIAFAIERHVTDGADPFPAWHADRSRNDLQACAQLMFGRDRLLSVIQDLLRLGVTAIDIATRYTDAPMPGYSHLQAAQVITPGFYLAALAEEALRAVARLRATHDDINLCPLGAGAMAGQELPWDLHRMSKLLGFREPARHATVAVASRGWTLQIAAELSTFGVVLGRFATDLMAWASGAYGFVNLPDSMAGISSAMPQKRNFPVLERIRGRSAHLTGYHFDLAHAQRATPYANMVEVSKEATAHLADLFDTTGSLLRLSTEVLARLDFDRERMRSACEAEYLGGFTLANNLALDGGIPWRQAQVVAGRYIVAAIERGLTPHPPDANLLDEVAAGLGFKLGHPHADARACLAGAFDVDRGLLVKISPGSTSPAAVKDLLDTQLSECDLHRRWCEERRERLRTALSRLDDAWGATDET